MANDFGEKASTGLILTKENWSEWIDYYEDVLIGKGLWGFTEKELVKPKDGESTTAYDADVQKDSKAVAILKRAAGQAGRVHLIGLRTSKAVIEKLREVNETSQAERVQSLLTRFHGFKSYESIDISASKLTQLQTEIGLAMPEEKPSDISKKAVLIQSLPEQYQSTVFALKAAGLTGLSFETVVQRLRDVESAMEPKEAEESIARSARNTPYRGGGGQGKKDREMRECFHCRRPGHLKSDCWALHPEKKPKGQRGQRGQRQEQQEETSYAAWAAISTQSIRPTDWVLDSGATRHMTGERDWFVDYSPFQGQVTIADGKILRIQGKGTIKVFIDGDKVPTPITEVFHVPDIGYNLLSISQLTERRIFTAFNDRHAVLTRDKKVLAKGTLYGKTYAIRTTKAQVQESAAIAKQQDVSLLWHRRLAHPSDDKLKVISEAVDGIPTVSSLSSVCETCATTKATRQQGKQPVERATEKLRRVHLDYWGPYKHSTIGGNRYMLTITDDMTRKSWIILTKDRTAIYSTFAKWQATAELESGCKLKAVRADNAPEIVALVKGLKGVVQEPTTAYTPEQNGVAERLNRTLVTKARSMLAAAELPKKLWGEAVYTACYLKNITPVRGTDKTPEELWTGRKPTGGHLRVFGCVAYPFVPHEKRDKLDNTAFKGVFVGYSLSAKQYRIWNPTTNAVRLYSSVRFDESAKGGLLGTAIESYKLGERTQDSVFDPEEDDEPTEAKDPVERPTENRQEEELLDEGEDEDSIIVGPGPLRRNQRQRRPPSRFREEELLALKVDYRPHTEVMTPRTYEEAINGPNAREWKEAIKDHLNSLAVNQTWDLVRRQLTDKVVTVKWIFKVKKLPNGQIDKFKARLVAQGYTQQYGIDYFETFAPVVRLESLRILLAIAAVKDLEVHQMDVVSAYLLGNLEEEVYLEPPEGLQVQDRQVLKLRKGLPGLKQSGRVWNQTITAFFEEFGLLAIPADHSVFANKDYTLIVALYVDDLIILAKRIEEIIPLKARLTEKFEMKDLGEVKVILGIRVIRNRQERTIHLDQTHYIEETLKEHELDLQTSFSVSTPANGYDNLIAPLDNDSAADSREYQRLIGKLNWIVRATRPDIAFVTQKLSQFIQNPTIRHLGGAVHLLKYLGNTREYRIQYSGSKHQEIQPLGYSDSDYAADQSRKSTMAYLFKLGEGPISWSSKLQRSVSTSTTEAEYIGLSYASKEAVWIRSFLEQIGQLIVVPLTVLGDNDGAIALVKNPEFHARTKHIDVSVHYVRELVEDKRISIGYISTKDMLADCLTKPLSRQLHERNVIGIGLVKG